MQPTPADPALENPSALPDASFHMAVVHFYRAEMNRMTVWRMRLDRTSNWAILLTTGMTTFTLGAVSVPHYTLLLGLALIGFCLAIEARRYQHLHHSKWRLQVMERYYFGEALDPHPREGGPDWRAIMSADLRQPHYTISRILAMRLRLRRNYLALVYFATGVWLTKLFLHPTNVGSWSEFYERLAMGNLFPSWFVVATSGMFVAGATALALITPSEEALEDWTHREHGSSSTTSGE